MNSMDDIFDAASTATAWMIMLWVWWADIVLGPMYDR